MPTCVAHYNHVRDDESIDNLTIADVYFGRAETILAERQRIKRALIRRSRALALFRDVRNSKLVDRG
jgi:hypothetical protein